MQSPQEAHWTGVSWWPWPALYDITVACRRLSISQLTALLEAETKIVVGLSQVDLFPTSGALSVLCPSPDSLLTSMMGQLGGQQLQQSSQMQGGLAQSLQGPWGQGVQQAMGQQLQQAQQAQHYAAPNSVRGPVIPTVSAARSGGVSSSPTRTP